MGRLAVLILGLMLTFAAPASAQLRILVMGDSFLAAHQNTGRSVGDILEAELGADVANRPIAGAWMIYRLPLSGAMGFRIPSQYVRGDWDWVVLNGGGNDLWLGCGCNRCDARLDRMISADGRTGVIPDLVTKLRAGGARVLYTGYLRSPGRGSPIEGCRDEGDALDARIEEMAGAMDGVWFLSNANLVPNGDASFHSWDMIHPSPKGSAAVAARVIAVLREAEARGE